MVGSRILAAGAFFFLAIFVGGMLYRGPAPLASDADPSVPSAARMRENLNHLLGVPAQQHSAGSPEGVQFRDRLQSYLDGVGAQTTRIDIPFDLENQSWHPSDRIKLLPESPTLHNLLATIPGKSPELAPIVIATHHDSCPWGPGAGDAGSAVVALAECARLLGQSPPQRTTHFVFSDGEEFGLLGVHALFGHNALPINDPAFVLNFDARGTLGGVPMFETHDNNAAWANAIINDLAFPKITTSLAVLVYRTLPNATDFDVYRKNFGWPGFNYATIGGAYHYHTPHDTPENVSDRTLQHMGNHVAFMHHAIDRLSKDELQAIRDQTTSQPSNAVFFDVLGLHVFIMSSATQVVLAVIGFLAVWWRPLRNGIGNALITVLKILPVGLLLIIASVILGFVTIVVLKQTPYHSLRYTPVDLEAGLITIAVTTVAITLLAEVLLKRVFRFSAEFVFADAVWMIVSTLGLVAAFFLPAGAYILVFPVLAYGIVAVIAPRQSLAAWFGWCVMALIVGPVLVLLVQSIGPWKQPIYAVIAGLLCVPMAAVWFASHKFADPMIEPDPSS
ncbi:M28 family peptidase [Rhodopirellula sp. MGV]|uniref:M28 family peptidase n=1 Tax=Rhodopirellula sp. MGV TaxID=2023130 RepID=UPI000B979964|nr:M28 family peptidase [Rhodopirellula sp. MGV]OYP34234.1 hypothetical protein CGZ80_15745 [Rhodopirellula sp. MGV]PNY35021.1 hypothetical protein C2E31_20115 [Rhodopirellula baltica]